MLSPKGIKPIMAKCYTPKCMGAELKQTHCRSSSLARVFAFRLEASVSQCGLLRIGQKWDNA